MFAHSRALVLIFLHHYAFIGRKMAWCCFWYTYTHICDNRTVKSMREWESVTAKKEENYHSALLLQLLCLKSVFWERVARCFEWHRLGFDFCHHRRTIIRHKNLLFQFFSCVIPCCCCFFFILPDAFQWECGKNRKKWKKNCEK